jgi:cytochrome bd ubiquinol oxidase subunit I
MRGCSIRWALLTNPYLHWQFPHVIVGSMVTASMVMAGVGAYYVLAEREPVLGRVSLRVGVISGVIFSVLSLFPTGTFHAENIAARQPSKLATMEGLFETQPGAPIAIIGMPDAERGLLLDPIVVPRMLSYLIYGSGSAKVTGLNDIPAADRPPMELVYYAYHIMVGLGTIFIAINVIAALALWRGWLYRAKPVLWALMIAMPFPYIANEAGWMVAEIGRQPWVVYGVLRTAAATSTNVSGGMTIFTLLGFMGLYLLLGLLYLMLFLRIIDSGTSAPAHAEAH